MNQAELENYLWGAATTLRGKIDAGDYKQYIFPLLFFKRICDVYDEEFSNALTKSKGDTEYAAFTENHHELEKLVHQTLQHFRHKKNREFFNCQIDTAAKIIRDLAKENLKYQEINYTIDEEEEIEEEEEIKENNIMNEFDKKFYYALAILGIFIFMFYVWS